MELGEFKVVVPHVEIDDVARRGFLRLLVGQSCGRSRQDRYHRRQVPIKDIYLYPLSADFKKRLCA
jgi:hypothetical protein